MVTISILATVTTEVIGDEDDAMIAIIETAPSDLLIKEGESSTLSCTSDHPWFFCVWVHPSGSKKCSLAEEGEYKSVCEGMENIRIRGDGNTCQLDIMNITQEDQGEYMCLLSQAEVFHTDRVFVNVEVATPANLSIRKVGDQEDSTMLDMVEGETVELVCEVTGAYPPPDLVWTIPGVEDIVVTNTTQSYYTYTPHYTHTGNTIQCSALQTYTHYTLYTHTLQIPLQVTRVGHMMARKESGTVSMGIMLAMIIIILCLTTILVFLFRRKKVLEIPTLAQEEPNSPVHNNLVNNIATIYTMEREGLYTSTPQTHRHSSEKHTNYNISSDCNISTDYTISITESSSSHSNTQSLGDLVDGNFISFIRPDSDILNNNYEGNADIQEECAHRAYRTLQDEDTPERQADHLHLENKQNILQSCLYLNHSSTSLDSSPDTIIMVLESDEELSEKEVDIKDMLDFKDRTIADKTKLSNLPVTGPKDCWKVEPEYHIEDSPSVSYILISSDKDDTINHNNDFADEVGASLVFYDETATECDSELLSDSVNVKHAVDISVGDDTVNITFVEDEVNCCEL